MNAITLSLTALQDMAIAAAKSGRFFGVTFEKRSDKSLRTMVCRGGVSKGRKGGKKGYDAAARGLLSVWECQMSGRLYGSRPEAGFRSISLEGILEVRCGGQVYRLEQSVAMAA